MRCSKAQKLRHSAASTVGKSADVVSGRIACQRGGRENTLSYTYASYCDGRVTRLRER